MRFLILGLNYQPEKVGVAVYSTGLAEALAARGHSVRVVAAHPYYPRWRKPGLAASRHAQTEEHGVAVWRVPIYVPEQPTTARRMLHHLSFAASSLWPVLRSAHQLRPDIVVAIAPSLIAAPVAWLASKVFGGRSWLHIQDFEVDAAEATRLFQRRSGFGQLVLKLSKLFERAVLGRFAVVSAISAEMCEQLPGKGARTFVSVPNWLTINPNLVPRSEQSQLRARLSITTPHVALYSGTMSLKQDLRVLIEAARLLAGRTDLTFLLCGEGPGRPELMSAARGLENFRIVDLQEPELLEDLYGLGSLHLLPMKAGIGDSVLPSKLMNMLASGRPVIALTEPHTSLAREIGRCGVVLPPGRSDLLAASIHKLLDDRVLAASIGAEGRRRAVEAFSRDKIVAEFEAHARALVPKRQRR